jgi:hypothetical protein
MSNFALLCSLPAGFTGRYCHALEVVMKRLIGSLFVAGVLACRMVAWAEPASGVVGTVIGRGTYEPFKFKTDPASPVDFEARDGIPTLGPS